MKILAIGIKNLASLEGATRIDFTQEPLCSAGIFAITGPTGAGKSTILDAICLALYGKTPRYLQGKESGIDVSDSSGSTIAQGDVRGILRDGTADGHAEVDFVGIDGEKYKASWRVKRAYGRIDGALQGETLSLSNLNSGLLSPGTKTEILKELERLVGLNFEQFTRSVLLAQGDFTAFLKASKDEKASLLEKLTGNYVYSEISKLVYEKYKAAEQELRDLVIQKDAFAFLDDEQRQLLEQQQVLLDQQIGEATKNVAGLEQEHLWHVRRLELDKAVAGATAALVVASGQKENAAPRYVELQRINEVQQCQTWVEASNKAAIQQADKIGALDVLKENAALLVEESSEAQTELDLQRASLAQSKKNKTDAGPIIERAKRLDVLISERREQVNKAEGVFKEAINKKALHDQREKEKSQQVNELQTRIENLQTWKKANSHRQPIAEHFALISSKLHDTGNLLSTTLQVQADLQENEGILATAISDTALLTETLIEKNAVLSKKKAAYELKYNAAKGIDIDDLNGRKATKDAAVEDVIMATAHWRLTARELSEQKIIQDRLKNNGSTVEKKEGLLVTSRKQLADAKIQKDTSGKILESARLKVADNVVSLRGTLKPEEPCPVCGSLEHPYTSHEPVLDGVLIAIENECKQHEQAYEGYLHAVSALSNDLEILRGQNSGDEQLLDGKATLISTLNSKWQKFQVYEEVCNSIADIEKETWLLNKTQVFKKEQQSLLGEITAFHQEKQSLEVLGKEISAEELAIAGINKNLGIKTHEKQTITETINRLKRELAKGKGDLNALQIELNPHFHQTDWFGKWQEDPESFLQQLTQFAGLWRTKTTQLEADFSAIKIAGTELQGIQQQTGELLSAVNKTSATFEQIKMSLDKELGERAELFEGRPTLEVEKELDAAIAKSEEQVNLGEKALQLIKDKLTQNKAESEQVSKDLIALGKVIEENAGKADRWLTVYNTKHQDNAITTTQLIQLLSFSFEWRENENGLLKKLEDELTIAVSVADERKKNLAVHLEKRTSEKEAEEVDLLLAEKKAAADDLKHQKSENSFKLEHDEKNKTKARQLVVQIAEKREVAENWGKLNEMIGSADGKKFRQIAQEFTLDVLLTFANIHLKILSKRYYIGRIPGTLGLQVTDRDMGDELRTIFSLSGGESFLVSLALALGLAELSSSKMNVESLFIDEGFGSLDPQTLTIAMGALEGLHNQGRKVGVISHVQEMTERIPAQIQVNKLANGKSEIKIDLI